MANRAKISTKTTRNKNFNSYESGYGIPEAPYFLNTVTSATATKTNQNIKLLDVDEAIEKAGALISADSANNTTLIEISLDVNHETALRLYDYSLGNIPDQKTNPKGYKEYLYYKEMLEQSGLSYDSITSWISVYKDGDSLNEDAGITFDKDTKYKIYGAPEQVVLNNRQKYNNCGVESTLNTLAMAGYIKMNENLKDQEKVQDAFLKSVWERNLANDSGVIGVLDEPDGGTMVDDYRDIMQYFGISSKTYFITNKSDEYVYPKDQLYEFANKIKQGYGAIIGVCSDVLWKNAQSESNGGDKKLDHAVAVTGVVYDENTNNPVGFFIQDTGGWMTKFISYNEFLDATLCDYIYGDDNTDTTLKTLREYDSKTGKYIEKTQTGIFATITDEPIKKDVFNIDATGDKNDNIIIGNNSNNVIKGMNGNDTLYGRAGQDTISGGANNDIIIGNSVLDITATYKQGLDEKLYEYSTIDDFKYYLDKADVSIGTKIDNLDKTVIKPLGTFDSLTDLYDYIKNNIPVGINTLNGDAGNDIIIGGEQADLIYGGSGQDYIYGGDGRNAIYGGAGNDVVIGGYDNDRLLGDAGNDTIFGLADDDVIDGGAGNDHLWGGRGSDEIETGKGNDTVYFEGTNFGQDEIMSKGGSTILKFVEEGETAASKVSDFFFSLEVDQQNDKMANLHVQYKQGEINDNESKVTFDDFYTIKSGKYKTVYIDSDTEDDIYTVSTSKKAKATVANTKDAGRTKINGQYFDNSKINNVLLTIYDGTTITTSKKNDIVTMVDNGSKDISTNIDTITYTGGKDKYISEDRNTYYYADEIDEYTNLSVYDNVIGLTKVITDDFGYIEEIDPNYTSKDDRLYLGSAKSDINYLFDVSTNGTYAITTQNAGLYLVGDVNYMDIISGYADGGFIYMDSFFKYIDNTQDTQITGTGFYGNGRIEGIYYNGSDIRDEYTTYDLTTIAANVATWLENNIYGYTSAFEAFANAVEDEANISGLIAAYSTPNPPIG